MNYTRLDDREARNGKSLARKQVYLVQDGAREFVELRFGTEFAHMYRQTLEAFRTVPSRYIGRLLAHDDATLRLEVEYLGAQVEPVLENLPRVVDYIYSLGQVQSMQRPFSHWRYIETLQDYVDDAKLKEFWQVGLSRQDEVLSGFGIGDPVIGNYVYDGDDVHLVDLDYFSSEQSVYYQIGFVIADVDVISGSLYVKTVEELVQRSSSYGAPKDIPDNEFLPLLVGYVSRLGIDVINMHKKLDSFRGVESENAILELVARFLGR